LNRYSPNCNTDENCAQYAFCYIIWWKLHNTIGPAIYFSLEQDDDFFDQDEQEIRSDSNFLLELFLHHFDDVQQILDVALVGDRLDLEKIFDDPTYWTNPGLSDNNDGT